MASNQWMSVQHSSCWLRLSPKKKSSYAVERGTCVGSLKLLSSDTLQKNDHISHMGKRKIILKSALLGDMLVPRRVCLFVSVYSLGTTNYCIYFIIDAGAVAEVQNVRCSLRRCGLPVSGGTRLTMVEEANLEAFWALWAHHFPSFKVQVLHSFSKGVFDQSLNEWSLMTRWKSRRKNFSYYWNGPNNWLFNWWGLEHDSWCSMSRCM